MFANRRIIPITLVCAGIFVLAVGVRQELQDATSRERVLPTSPVAGPTALPKPTLASPSPADASVLANSEVIALLDHLRQHGIALENPDESRVAFLYPVPGVAYRIGRGGLSVHPFPNREAAQKRAAEIPGELARPTTGDWVDQPHFYRCQSSLILYLGRDTNVLQALDEWCGPSFAGS